jgi:hypothetical protein
VDHDANTKVANLYFQQSLQYEKRSAHFKNTPKLKSQRDVLSLTRGNKTGFLLDWVSILSQCHATGYNKLSNDCKLISLALRMLHVISPTSMEILRNSYEQEIVVKEVPDTTPHFSTNFFSQTPKNGNIRRCQFTQEVYLILYYEKIMFGIHLL